ncbi:MAG: lipoate--protein ligase family protein [Pseudomonadota bacterium]
MGGDDGRYGPLVFPDAAAGLDAEMTLLAAVAEGRAGASAFLWRATAPGFVVPRPFTRAPRWADVAAMFAAEGHPVVERKTGGGITPQGPGVLNLALAWTLGEGTPRAIPAAYGAICAPLVAGFAALGMEAGPGAVAGSFCDGDFNLEVGGRKIVGTAQRWRRRSVMAHALILTDLEIAPSVARIGRLAEALDRPLALRDAAHVRLVDVGVAEAAFIAALATELAAGGYASWGPS